EDDAGRRSTDSSSGFAGSGRRAAGGVYTGIGGARRSQSEGRARPRRWVVGARRWRGAAGPARSGDSARDRRAGHPRPPPRMGALRGATDPHTDREVGGAGPAEARAGRQATRRAAAAGLAAGFEVGLGPSRRLDGRNGQGQPALLDEDPTASVATEEPRIVIVTEVFHPDVAAM